MPDHIVPRQTRSLHRPLHPTLRWIGDRILARSPLARMLHTARAEATAQRLAPMPERTTYTFRKKRIYARGREAYADPNSPEARAAAAAEAAEAAGGPAEAGEAAAADIAAAEGAPRIDPAR